MDIAVIGGGIFGPVVRLAPAGGDPSTAVPTADGAARIPPRVTVYEANDYLGGHTRTVDIDVDGYRQPVDTGFLVFNHRTYPRLVELFATLDVATVASEMTFSVHVDRGGRAPIEWAGTDLDAVFAQRRNLLRPRFLRMLADLFRFKPRRDRDGAGGDAGAGDVVAR